MKNNFKKILPAIFSIVLFSSIFIFLIIRNADNTQVNLQLSPNNYLYKEKFGETKSYSVNDISSNEFITNVRINQTPGASEPKIVCNPRDENILVLSSNDFLEKDGFARLFISEDAGINWQQKEISLSSKFSKSSYSDPFMDYDSDGNLYYVSVQFDLNNNYREGLFFAKSNDNGETWKTDFNFIDYNGKENIHLDRPKIYADKIGSSGNHIYVTWLEIQGYNSFIMFSKSSDGGETFSLPAKIEKNYAGHFSLVSNSKGELYLVYLKDETKIVIKKSIDKGVSWSSDISNIKIIPSGIKSENQYVIKSSQSKGIRINSEPSVIISKDDDIYITFSAAGKGNDIADIYFIKLKKNSDEITKPVRVNSDETKCDQFLPTLAVDNFNNLVIMYQDSRNDILNIQTETYISYSNDGGLKFRDIKISTKNFNASKVSVGQYIGDYNSCLFSGDKFVGVWTDGRNNNLDIYAGIFSINKIIESINH